MTGFEADMLFPGCLRLEVQANLFGRFDAIFDADQ
jgi:hypothetical protein